MSDLPTYKEAKEIVDNAEIINKGTGHEFIKGCYGNKCYIDHWGFSLGWLMPHRIFL